MKTLKIILKSYAILGCLPTNFFIDINYTGSAIASLILQLCGLLLIISDTFKD